MSLNGDTIVMRNGRSTSQVSVYNYPEHLNPFYEDDQHKRLRFWKINKNKNKKNEGWRGSLTSLRDMWAFKSFNLKKKSSTLGINKTSESPPQSPLLRRQFNGSDNTSTIFNPDDRRARYTISAQGSPSLNNNFERNQPYRSSLQNISNGQNSSKGIGFNRNDQYRSTTQFAGFSSNNLKPTSSTRLSQTSLASTNPFDSDDDCIEVNQTTQTQASPMKNGVVAQRKKRKAPPPPVRAIKSENVNPSNESWENTTLQIKENDDIINLTAEINNFVKISNEASGSTELLHRVDERRNNVQTDRPTPSNTIAQTEAKPAKSEKAPVLTMTSDTPVSKNNNNESNNAAEPQPQSMLENITITETETEKSEEQSVVVPTTTTNQEVGKVESIRINIYGTSKRSSPEKTEQVNITTFQKPELPATKPKLITHEVTKKTYFTLAQPPKSLVETDTNDIRRKSETRKVSFEQQVIADEPIRNEIQLTETPKVSTTPQETAKSCTAQLITSEQSNAAATATTPTKPVCSPRRKSSKQMGVSNANTSIGNVLNSEVINQQVPQTRNSLHSQQIVIEPAAPHTKGERVQSKPEVNVREYVNVNTLPDNIPRSKDLNQNTQEVHILAYETPNLNNNNNNTHTKELNKIVVKDQPPAYEEQFPVTTGGHSKETNGNGIESRSNSTAATTMTTRSSEVVVVSSPLKIVEAETSTPQTEVWTPTIEFPPLRWSQSNSNATSTENVNQPMSKRKSVKDIIESINKSQRLLTESATKGTSVYSTSLYSQNNAYATNILSHSTQDKEANDTCLTNLGTANTFVERQNVEHEDAKQPNSGDSFKKHKINKVVCQYRESSPTSSNLDWNPLPKPKRIVNSANKHLSD